MLRTVVAAPSKPTSRNDGSVLAISAFTAHPVFSEGYACVEHGAESLKRDLGDALGTDCFIQKLVEVDRDCRATC